MLVLCYHAVSEDWRAPLSVTPAALEDQLTVLVRRGYRGATFSQAMLEPPAPRTVAVTFDDAYSSVLSRAVPVLGRLGLPGTVFVPTRFPGAGVPMSWDGIAHWVGGEHEHELAAMTWEELKTLRRLGWEVGSHTRSHPRLSTLDDEDLEEELAGSKADCESALGEPCETLAYPYGDHDDRVVEAAGRAGYRYACTLPSRLHPCEPLRWPRVGIYAADTLVRYRLKVSPAMRRLRSSGLWDRGAGLRRRIART